jgi:peptidoglycan-associated lipoprotein
MLIKHSLKVILLGASLLTLAACSTTGSSGSGAGAGNDQNGGVASVNANGAATSGVGQMTGFGGSGQGNANAMKVGNQSYYFDFNESTVHEADSPSIKVQANYLIAHPFAKVLLEGNTDVRGSREYNIGLGNRRALAVASVLEMDGVSKSQISTVSYGAEKPVALGNDETAYAKNRRVDLVYQGN